MAIGPAENLVGGWRPNPSIGLLQNTFGEVMTYVIIQGRNLDVVVTDRKVILKGRRHQGHRIAFEQEMDEEGVPVFFSGGLPQLAALGSATRRVTCVRAAS